MGRLLTLLIACAITGTLLAQDSQKPYIGIHFNHISEEKAQKLGYETDKGLQITNVMGNSAAKKAGLQAFDYLYGIDDYYFNDTMSLGTALRKYYKPGDEAVLSFYRKGKKQKAKTTVSAKSEVRAIKKTRFENPFFGISPSHAEKPEGVEGQAVNVHDNTTAKMMGLEKNDIITTINDFPIYDWHDVGTAIDDLYAGEPITVTWINDGETKTATMPIGNHDGAFKDYKAYVIEEDEVTEMPKEELIEKMDEAEIVQVAFQEVTEEEAEDMKEDMDIDMPLDNNLKIEQLKVFPNPTQGRFNLQFDLPESGETIIQVYNSVGQQIYNENLGDFSGQFQNQLDISNNARGLYFISIQQDGKSISQKLLLQ